MIPGPLAATEIKKLVTNDWQAEVLRQEDG